MSTAEAPAVAIAKKRGRPKKEKPVQKYIEGTEPLSIRDIDDAADNYIEARDSRINKLNVEIERKKELTELMQKHKLTEYKYRDQLVTFDGEPTVKVKKVKPPKMDE